MEVAILGFGSVAKEVIKQLKELKEYGDHIRVYCVHVRRNSLSYGPDSVVEIVDRFGDGLRVYKDGYQATDFRTTVSSFEDWLIGESTNGGAYKQVVDCMSYNDDSVRLILRMLRECDPKTKFHLLSKELVQKHWKEIIDIANERGISISFNAIPSGDPNQYSELSLDEKSLPDLIDKEDQDLFIYRNGGPVETAKVVVKDIQDFVDTSFRRSFDWSVANRPVEWYEDARLKAEEAARAMEQRLLDRRIETTSASNKTIDPSDPIVPPEILDDMDRYTLKRFVADGDGNYKTSSIKDDLVGKEVIKHEMLEWFFSDHLMVELACNAFGDPNLVQTATRYIKLYGEDARIEIEKSNTCTRSVVYLSESDDIVLLKSKDFKVGLAPNEAMLYCSDIYDIKSNTLKEMNNRKVEYVEFHFGQRLPDGTPPQCSCFDGER